MSDFGKIHRGFYRHRKVEQCSNGAIGLWAKANSLTRDKRSAGYIPREVILELGTREEANELFDARLWVKHVVDGVVVGAKFNDYENWNDDVEPDTEAGNLVREIIPETHPVLIRKQLVKQASQLLSEGLDRDYVAGALKLWLSKSLSPSLLPSLASEAMKDAQRVATVRNTVVECLKTGQVSPMKPFGYLFTPPDPPDGLDVQSRRAFMEVEKRKWLNSILEKVA